MKNIQTQIESRISAIVSTMTEEMIIVLREAAIEAVNGAFSRLGEQEKRPPTKTKRHEIATQSVVTTNGYETRETKISDGLLASLYNKIEEAPGKHMGEYAKMLGVPSKTLRIPMLKLRQSNQVKMIGQRSEALYFPIGWQKNQELSGHKN